MITCYVHAGIEQFNMDFPRVPVVGDWISVDIPNRHLRKVTRVIFYNDGNQPTIKTVPA